MKLKKEYLKVFEELLKVPEGKVTTYGALAKKSNLPSPRLVGKILHNNPNEKKYPCHRVVRGDRKFADSFAFGDSNHEEYVVR